MALERLVGEEEQEAHCHCGQTVSCPEHGAHKYRGVRPGSIKDLLIRHGISGPGTLLDLRHPLVHGSLKFTFEKRLLMRQAVPELWRAVEQELRTRLGAREALNVQGRGRSSVTFNIHCQYRTAYPEQPFPVDCPTCEEVEEYKRLLREGLKHPKIITLLDWPPVW